MHDPVSPVSVRRILSGCVLALAATIAVTASDPARAAGDPVTVTAPPVDNPKRVLFVGNSYFYYGDSLHNHARRMADAADPGFLKAAQFKSATIGGASLDHHDIGHLTEPGRIGVKEPFQLVILQGGSAEPLNDKRAAKFRDTVAAFDKVIRERGGRTALYMTHAYVAPHKLARPENIELTEKLYRSVGNQVGALVIPVGLAFEEAYRRRPDLKLHKSYDGSHPELIGTYLAAATVYASVYGKSPVGNAYDYYGKIDADTVRFLQQVAHDTVKGFFGR